MPLLNPPRCSNAVMSPLPGVGVLLLNNSGYPTNGQYTNKTYLWDGSNWATSANSIIDPLGPLPTRIGACSSETSSNNSLVLFGGQSMVLPLNDTWVYLNGVWTKANPTTIPNSRIDAAMSCGFSVSSNVLMFGGKNEVNLHGDTWLWNNTNWTRQILAVSPGARYGAKLVGGISAGRDSILFGGASHSTMFNDTWKWNDISATWSQVSVAVAPSGRMYHSMSKDTANSSVIVLFGGTDNSNIFSDTWVFDGTSWVKKTPITSPPARYGAQMSYDFIGGSVLLFGGTNGSIDFNDTWKWTGTNWIQL